MVQNFLTTEQVAKILQVHPFTILKLIKSGKIKGIKIGRLYRINEEDVKIFTEGQTYKSANKEPREKKEIVIEDKAGEGREDEKEIYII